MRAADLVPLRARSALVLGLVSAVGFVAFFWPFLVEPGAALDSSHSGDAPFLFVALLPLLAAVVLAELTSGGMDAKSVAMLGMLSAVGGALRALGPGTAGLEPSFAVIILGGRVFGRGFGFVLGATTLLTGALITGGVGPWLPFQMMAAGWVGFLAGCLPQRRGRAELAIVGAYAAAAGLAFGVVMNIWFWPFASYGPEVSYVAGDAVAENLRRYAVFYLTTSLLWDIGRSVMSLLVIGLAGSSLLRALRRAGRRAAFDVPVVFEPRGQLMDVVVLGTGSADGWPNPFCTCASCTTERADGRSRAQTSALVDGRLLLDCGPETPRAADRAGLDLSGLRHVLITHRHPDHCSPAFLLFRSWVSDGAPLDVVGPAEVVEDCRRWVAPSSPVRFTEVVAGDRLRLGEYDVRVLAARHGHAGSTVLYDVAAVGGRLLYATDTAALPDETLEAVSGAAFDVVLMEETFGDHTGHGTDHLDLQTFPEELRRLREVGAIHEHTDVVAVHLSHRNPPTAELSRRLADWGARVVEDGTRLDDGQHGVRAPRRTLVVGGARSGKSREAERLLAAERDVTYVATAYPVGRDPEWDDRVRRHQVDRPALWRTVESLDLAGLLGDDGGPLLIDCLTLWLTRVMDRHEAWDEEVWAARAEKAVAAEIDALATAWRSTGRRVVAVTNEVGQGVVPDTASGRRFRDQMGRLNARLAAETEDVRWCVAGRVLPL